VSIVDRIVRVLLPPTPPAPKQTDEEWLASLGPLTRCAVIAERRRRSLPPERTTRGRFAGFANGPAHQQGKHLQLQRRQASLRLSSLSSGRA
jgi:hypothetical protein